MSIVKEYIASIIPTGKERAVKRSDLVQQTSYTDGEVRRMIAQARAEGLFICNEQDGRGYYISDDLADIEKQYRQDRARALSILARCKHMRRYLKANGVEVK